jgi:hypothetical protein
MNAQVLQPSESLTADDRCDRCGAQAYVRARLEGGSELMLCGHHARMHGAKLREISVDWWDETWKLS